MQQPIHKATFIIRLWTDSAPINANTWRGTAEQIGSGHSCHFQTLDECFDLLRQTLVKIDEKPK